MDQGSASAFAVRFLVRPRNLLLLLVLGVALGFLIERLIVTDAERIRGILDDIRDGCLEGDWTRVFSHLDPDFDYQGMTEAQVQAFIEQELQGKPLPHFEYFSREIKVLEGGRAEVTASVVTRLPKGAEVQDLLMTAFELKLRKTREAGWKIAVVRMIH